MESRVRIKKSVNLIIAYINNASLRNYLKSNIAKTETENEIEFEFRDKDHCYKTDEFKQILDNYCKNENITYEMHEPIPGIAHFKMKLN